MVHSPVTPLPTQCDGLAQRPPAQQRSPAEPQLPQSPVSVHASEPAQRLPEQHGSPDSPHDTHVRLAPRTSHVSPLVQVLPQHGAFVPPHASQVPLPVHDSPEEHGVPDEQHARCAEPHDSHVAKNDPEHVVPLWQRAPEEQHDSPGPPHGRGVK